MAASWSAAAQPVERLYREIRALRIYEGATEVQQLSSPANFCVRCRKHPLPEPLATTE